MHNLTKTLGYMCLEPPQGEPPLRLGIGCIELRVLPPAPKVNLVRESWIAKDIHIPLCILLQLLAVPLLADSLWDVVQSNGKVEYLLIQVASSTLIPPYGTTRMSPPMGQLLLAGGKLVSMAVRQA